MNNLTKRLERRGWGKKEISKAVKIIKSAKQDKSRGVLFLEERVYWVLLVIIICANFAIAMAMIPVLIALEGASLYLTVATLGASFGFLFELVIRSIERLEKRHHTFLAAFIPVTAFSAVFFIAKVSNDLMLMLGLENFHSQAAVAFVYAAFFAVPYLACRFILKVEYYSKG